MMRLEHAASASQRAVPSPRAPLPSPRAPLPMAPRPWAASLSWALRRPAAAAPLRRRAASSHPTVLRCPRRQLLGVLTSRVATRRLSESTTSRLAKSGTGKKTGPNLLSLIPLPRRHQVTRLLPPLLLFFFFFFFVVVAVLLLLLLLLFGALSVAREGRWATPGAPRWSQ